jgi:putative oxidoreductase
MKTNVEGDGMTKRIFGLAAGARDPEASIILVRIAVGCVFLSEGIQKFLFSAQLGVGRFAKIGIPAPDIAAPLVGALDLLSGILILAGFLTRFAAIPPIAIMFVAITTTKLPILASSGFWAMAHESRTDFSMLLGNIFLLVNGAGPLSLDALWGYWKSPPNESHQ